MAIPILNHLDLRNVSELQNATLHTTTRASASHKAGKIIYESAAVYVSDGSAWFDLSGDIKQVKVIGDSGNYDVTNGNFVLTIAGATGITTSVSSSTISIDLDDTSTDMTSTNSGVYGSATAIPVITVDRQGRLTAASTESIATALTVDGDSGAQNVDLLTDDLQILGTTNEITTAVTKPAVGGSPGTDVKVTIGLPNDVTIGQDLTVTRHLDVDGTSNLDAVDIDGNVQIDGTLSVGVNDTGYDVKFFGDTASKYLLWDASADKLIATGEIEAGSLDISGNADIDGTLDVDGVDIDGTLVVDGTNISLDSTSTLNIDNSSTTNGIKIGLATSGVPVKIGHDTSEVTIGDNLTVKGNFTVDGTTTTLNETVKVVENNTIEFEGTTADAHEIKLTGGEPTADRVVALPDNSGTIALTTDITARQFTTTIGNASAVTINILNSGASAPHKNHGLGADSTQFMIQLIEVSSGLTVMADVARGTSGAVAITFASAPAANAIRVLITKIG
jgi:cytoskeletal protein CcmA (bactofilin family)